MNQCILWLSQAWAVMEWKKGYVDVARQLFETGARVDSHHLHIWQVWIQQQRLTRCGTDGVLCGRDH